MIIIKSNSTSSKFVLQRRDFDYNLKYSNKITTKKFPRSQYNTYFPLEACWVSIAQPRHASRA